MNLSLLASLTRVKVQSQAGHVFVQGYLGPIFLLAYGHTFADAYYKLMHDALLAFSAASNADAVKTALQGYWST